MWLALLLSLLFSPLVCSAAPIDRVLESSVALEIRSTGREWRVIGSGTLIKNDGEYYIVSAQHVVSANVGDVEWRACSMSDREVCVDTGSYIVSGETSYEDDWALIPLAASPKGMRPARVSHRVLSIGDGVWQAGFPDGEAWINEGTISGRRDQGTGTYAGPIYSVHGYSYPGSSGGGVFDKRGRLVGITTMVAVIVSPLGMPNYSTSQAIVVPINNIENLE